MVEDWSGGEGLLQEEEYTLALAVAIPRGVFLHESVEGFGDSGVVVDESVIKVSKPQKGLYLLDIPQWRPIEYSFNLGGVHVHTIGSDNDPKVFDLCHVKGAFLEFGMKVILLESFQDAADMFWMLCRQIQVDQDVVQVHSNENVVHVMEDVIHEVLEGGGGVSHSKGHHKVLKEAIAGAKGGLPFMFQSDPDVVVAGAEVYLYVYLGTAETVNKISNQGEGILVFFSDFVESPIIHAESEQSILLLGKQDQSTGSGDQQAYEALAEHVVEVLLQGLELDLRHVVDLAKQE
ncbi:hypothetical protein C0989_001470 [Termitomyces sp. Mn162]|nr:hypothetical protein C0989_001470 [Termitomyces sp. Mn162]